MYRKSNEMTMKEAIRLLLDTYRLNGRLKEMQLIDSWEKVVGPMIARHTKSLYIKDKKLYVKLDSAPLRMELSYARARLIEMLNKEAGEEVIRELVLS